MGIAANLSTPHEVVFVIDFHYWPIASFKGAFFAGLSPEAAQIKLPNSLLSLAPTFQRKNSEFVTPAAAGESARKEGVSLH